MMSLNPTGAFLAALALTALCFAAGGMGWAPGVIAYSAGGVVGIVAILFGMVALS